MLKAGQVVFALAGRDKGNFFVVVACDKVYAQIADGKRRRLEKPKIKKLCHLRPTLTIVSGEMMGTNREIRKVLSKFNESNV